MGAVPIQQDGIVLVLVVDGVTKIAGRKHVQVELGHDPKSSGRRRVRQWTIRLAPYADVRSIWSMRSIPVSTNIELPRPDAGVRHHSGVAPDVGWRRGHVGRH